MQVRRFALIGLLCASMGAGAAEPKVVQDGIAVRPLSKATRFGGEEQLQAQAAQQYSGLLSKARQEGALAPDGNPQVQRLRAIAKRIIPHTARWNPKAAGWDWQVNLLGSDQVNAFCMPGGRIAFFSGLITQLNPTDDELAAVMGHEISHALRQHQLEQAVKSTGTQVVSRLGGSFLSAILGIDPRITDTVAQYGAQLYSLGFSRDDEREADLVGLDLAARAGYDPRAGITLWEKMGRLKGSGEPPKWLSSHPGGSERIKLIQQHLNVLMPLYARSKGVPVNQLQPYRPTAQR